MKVKASLHCHTSADLVEGSVIGYSVFDLIDRAQALDIRIVAHTCHRYFVWDPLWFEYAQARGILLIPGVELELADEMSANHTLAINCDASIDQVRNFADLASYRASHPELLVIAAHPNFGFGVSVGLAKLKQYWQLFDLVEQSWFYSGCFDLNRPVAAMCRDQSKPFIATADLHSFNFFCLETDYAVVEVEELTSLAVVKALRQGNFTNVSQPKSLPRLAYTIAQALYLDQLNKLTKKK